MKNTQNKLSESVSFVESLKSKYFAVDEVLESALALIPHKETTKDGDRIKIRNIYMLLKFSDEYAELMRRCIGYPTFANARGLMIQKKYPNSEVLRPMTKDILEHYGIEVTEEYLERAEQELKDMYDEISERVEGYVSEDDEEDKGLPF